MIKNVRHTGLVVRDLNVSVEFYLSLGFDLWKREIEKGDFIDKVTGINNVSLEWAKLKSPDGYLLELLQYHSHPEEKTLKKSNSNKLGCSHLAFTVKNISNTCDFIKKNGGSIVNEPVKSPDGKVKVAYCHDLDGIIIELVEEII